MLTSDKTLFNLQMVCCLYWGQNQNVNTRQINLQIVSLPKIYLAKVFFVANIEDRLRHLTKLFNL